MENYLIHLNKYFNTDFVQEESQTLKVTKCNVGRSLKWQSVCINLFCVLFDLNLNLQLDRNISSPPIAPFRFSNIVLRNQKSKKWQCSQNLQLNPTCVQGLIL